MWPLTLLLQLCCLIRCVEDLWTCDHSWFDLPTAATLFILRQIPVHVCVHVGVGTNHSLLSVHQLRACSDLCLPHFYGYLAMQMILALCIFFPAAAQCNKTNFTLGSFLLAALHHIIKAPNAVQHGKGDGSWDRRLLF